MITRITLDNFMSHAHTVIEPALGLTVITGPNNCGKSAVVEALRAVCENTPTDFMVRHGAKVAVVTVETDDGHKVVWRRRKTYSSYTIDGEQNDRPTDDYLLRVHEILRLPPVRASEGKDDFQVHIGTQKSPIFLLNESKLKQATFFASSSDAEKLLEMQRRHRSRVAEDKKTHARLSAEIATIDAKLATLQPLSQLVDDSKTLAAQLQDCGKAAAEIDRITVSAGSLRRWAIERKAQVERSSTLHDLAAPPTIQDESALAQLLQRIVDTRQRQAEADRSRAVLQSLNVPPAAVESEPLRVAIQILKIQMEIQRRADAVARSMQPIAPPPPMHPIAELDDCLIRSRSAAAKHRMTQSVVLAANSLNAPPTTTDISPLVQMIGRFRKAAEFASHARLAASGAVDALTAAKAEVVDWITENPKCPLCNGSLEADQLLAAGGHAHE